MLDAGDELLAGTMKRTDAGRSVGREAVLAAVRAGELIAAEQAGRAAGLVEGGERIGDATGFAAVHERGMADHPQVVVTEDTAALGQLEPRPHQLADERIG